VRFRLLLVLALGVVIAGCRRPGPATLQRGYVDLAALTRLHPAWPERDSLTALIASAHESHQHPIAPFRVPPDPELPTTPPASATDDAAERARMERLIQERIDRDVEAVRGKIEREVERFRETELATAQREIRLRREESTAAFLQRYRAVAVQYADRIAPLELEQVGLLPRLTDILLLAPEQREARAKRLAALEKLIQDLIRQRNAELREMQQARRAELQALRAQRMAAAEAAIDQYRRRRLAELEATRAQQQRQIRADLERSMRLQVRLPEVVPPVPGPTAEAARQRAEAISGSAAATMDRYHEAARDIEHKLYVQRQELEQTITDATRAAVLQLARTHDIAVSFTPAPDLPELTPRFDPWLRARWQSNPRQAAAAARR
jgi:hypothetical protein